MKGADNPVRQAVNINGYIAVDFRAPRRQTRSVFVEAVNGLFTHISNEVNCCLKVDTFLMHDNGNHVMGITLGLLDVVRKDVLDKYIFRIMFDWKNGLTLTLDHVTRSLAASPKLQIRGCSITSSGISRLPASRQKAFNKNQSTADTKKNLHSISAQHGLQPEVSRRKAM